MNSIYALYSRLPFKTAVGKAIASVIPKDLVVPILFGRLRGKKWIVGSSNLECALGVYEREKAELFAKVVGAGSTIYDIGAHVGFYTVLSSQLVGSKGRVVAFEPFADNMSYLQRHISMNLCENVTAFQIAVSDKNGVTGFLQGETSSMGRLSTSGGLFVQTSSIDALLAAGKIPPPNFMKIDIEGAELLALEGAKSTMLEHRPTIFLATHGPSIHVACCDLLKTLGYRIDPIGGDSIAKTDELYAYVDES
jgi:FkbM family methyltransferase